MEKLTRTVWVTALDPEDILSGSPEEVSVKLLDAISTALEINPLFCNPRLVYNQYYDSINWELYADLPKTALELKRDKMLEAKKLERSLKAKAAAKVRIENQRKRLAAKEAAEYERLKEKFGGR